MKIGVLIPAYNSERYLAGSVQSVLGQTIENWQAVIVDDGSSDRTAEIAARLSSQDDRIRVVSQSNSGVAIARNRAFAACSPECDYLCFLDSDDLLEPAALETLSTRLKHNPTAIAAHGTARFIDHDGRGTRYSEIEGQVRGRYAVVGNEIVATPNAGETTFAMLIVANCIVTPGAALIRRSALEAAGEFDQAMSPCEDWDMWIRLARLGDIAFVDQHVVAYRRHATNATNDMGNMWRASDRVRVKATCSLLNDPLQAHLARFVLDHPATMEYHARMTWARECLAQGHILSAAKQLRHAARARARMSSPYADYRDIPANRTERGLQ